MHRPVNNLPLAACPGEGGSGCGGSSGVRNLRGKDLPDRHELRRWEGVGRRAVRRGSRLCDYVQAGVVRWKDGEENE